MTTIILHGKDKLCRNLTLSTASKTRILHFKRPKPIASQAQSLHLLKRLILTSIKEIIKRRAKERIEWHKLTSKIVDELDCKTRRIEWCC